MRSPYSELQIRSSRQGSRKRQFQTSLCDKRLWKSGSTLNKRWKEMA
ncbi:rCG60526 [Rattus norvegicus]|uniref:RCG60526 n=1 Tax=Rattus norvegicus TaxID=10116 RepID=A6KKI4_RAT|nr:rCG60526 [Rattus norvegicus]